jgi:hypothetical protein
MKGSYKLIFCDFVLVFLLFIRINNNWINTKNVKNQITFLFTIVKWCYEIDI